MTSQEQFEAWASEHLPTLYLTKTDEGDYVSPMTRMCFMGWSARDSAVKTLERLGYTDNGGELWKPPLGKKPDFGLISSLRAECGKLSCRLEAARARFSRWNGRLIDSLREARDERDKLRAECEALRAEAAKWKNESVSDSQTIYALSCNLAQRTGEVRELADVVDDLSALTKRFVQRLRKAAPGNDLPEKALDYLKRKGLQGSAMREIVEGRLS